MPSSLIKKLDLDFPQSRSRRYGNVPPPIVIQEPGQSNQSEKLPSTSNVKKLVTVTGTIETNFIKHQNEVKAKEGLLYFYCTPLSKPYRILHST